MSKVKTIICMDRDGTLINDCKFHLGRTDDWKDKFSFLPTVLEGLKLLKQLEGSKLYMLTNQPGIAAEDFDKLTHDRVDEVCDYLTEQLLAHDACLDGYFFCPYVTPTYSEKRDEHTWNENMVCDCSCVKPNIGMVVDALKDAGVERDAVTVYMIGDRMSDVQTGLNAGGVGIFVPFENEKQELELFSKFSNHTNVIRCSTFLEAVQEIVRRENGS